MTSPKRLIEVSLPLQAIAVFHTDVSLGSIPAHICSKIVRLDIYPYLQYHSRVGHTPHVWRFPWPGPGASALPASLYLQAQR